MITKGPYCTTAGRRRTFGSLSVWAEDGLIFCEWQKKSSETSKTAGDVEALDVSGAKRWLKEMHNDLVIWDKAREGAPTPKDRAYAIEYFHTLKGQMDAINETIRDAVDQGDQSDTEIRRKKLGAFLRSNRSNLMGDTSGLASVSSLLFPVGYQAPKVFTTGKIALFPPLETPPLRQ